MRVVPVALTAALVVALLTFLSLRAFQSGSRTV